MEIGPAVNSQWFVDISEPNSSRGTPTRFIIGSNSTCTFSTFGLIFGHQKSGMQLSQPIFEIF